MNQAIKIDEQQSLSWVILGEASITGLLVGYFIVLGLDAHPVLGIVGGGAVIALVYNLVIHVSFIFWVWTISFSGIGAFLTIRLLHRFFRADDAWSFLWGGIVAIIIIAMHTQSRKHNLAEDNRISVLKD